MRLLTLLSTVLLLLSATACKRERTSVAIDAGLLTLMPEDSVAVGALRVKALGKTAAWKDLLAKPEVNRQLERLANETSFDARKYLWEIAWSTNGKDALFYARGEFAPLGLEPKIEKEGVKRLNYKGSMLIGNDEAAVWFVNSSTAVFGPTPAIHKLIDSRDVRAGGPSQVLRDRMDKIPPAAHAWMVATAAGLPAIAAPKAEGPAGNLAANLPKLLASMQTITFHASLVDGIAYELLALCNDEQGARQVHDSMRGILGIARFSLPAERKALMLPVLDAVQVEQKQTEAVLRGRVTTSQYEEIAALMTPKPGEKKAD